MLDIEFPYHINPDGYNIMWEREIIQLSKFGDIITGIFITKVTIYDSSPLFELSHL